jgi:hypothetical protein
MADPIVFTKEPVKWQCGNDLSNITLATFGFQSPGKKTGAKDLGRAIGCAYSCNMNMDLDGEPQAYGPLSKVTKTLDWLQNGGWLSPDQNAAVKAAYEELEQVQKKIGELKAAPKADPDAKGPQPELEKLQKELEALKTRITKHLHGILFGKDAREDGVAIKYHGEKFWHWYGVRAYTPEEASKRHPYTEVFKDPATGREKRVERRPTLETDRIYEDAFGRFPVIQSEYEPGQGFYVSKLATPVNTAFPEWDQRYNQLPDATAKRPYAALSKRLGYYTGLKVHDRVLGIRPDTGDTLEFPFLDTGYGQKVGECSIEAFTLLGGKFGPQRYAGKPNPINNFPVLFVSFYQSATKAITASLAEMAQASNAEELPALLAFLAQATADALARRKSAVAGEPFDDFVRWQKQKPHVNPPLYDLINQKLVAAGFKP